MKTTLALIPLMALCSCEPSPPPAPPAACMKHGEIGIVSGVHVVTHRYRNDHEHDYKQSSRTFVKFTMPDGTVRICQSSDGATALSAGDKVSAARMTLTDLGADVSTDNIGRQD